MITAKGREISTLDLLYLCDEDFKDDVKRIRDKYSIKTEVDDNDDEIVPIDEFMLFDKKFIHNELLRKQYLKLVEKLVSRYELDGLSEELQLYIESGESTYTTRKTQLGKPLKIFKPRVVVRELRDFDKKYSVPIGGVNVVFNVRKKIFKEDLIEWVKKHADTIAVQVNDYLSDYSVGITKLTKTERIVEVIKTREKYPNKTWSEIADIISNKNPNDPDSYNAVINPKSIEMLYKRYKKRFKKK